MRLSEPSWWYKPGPRSFTARALGPIGALYGFAGSRKFSSVKPYRARFPVICIGNFTAGGTGKTPLALHICEELRAAREHPVFLTRGFAGQETGPLWVDLEKHTAADVGDEPLLLARVAPTLVARDRASGAKFIESGGRRASVIIMDDGLQNPQLYKDLSIAVIDARRGVGNGAVIPAGPLRAPLAFQLGLADAIIINHGGQPVGENSEAALKQLLGETAKRFSGRVVGANVRVRGETSWLGQTPTVAFAGIANPNRFFDMLEGCGAQLAAKRVFPDHHDFSEADAQSLLQQAFDLGARLVTTEKDLVRLRGQDGHRGELFKSAVPLPVGLAFSPLGDIQIDELLSALPGRAGTD